MKSHTIISIMAWTGMMTAVVFAANNPSVTTPGGSPTAVPSSGRSGLIQSRPNTWGYSGNQMVSGNVGGGRHFRGVVPYGSQYYSSSTSNTSVDDFIRRSSGSSIANDRNPGAAAPYYDPRRTVSSINRAGQSGLNTPQLQGQWRSNTNPAAPAGLPQTTNTPFSRQRPFGDQTGQLEQMLEKQMNVRRDIKPKTTLPADMRPPLDEVKSDEKSDLLKPQIPALPEKDPLKIGKQTQPDAPQDSYSQIRESLGNLIKEKDKTSPAEEPQKLSDKQEDAAAADAVADSQGFSPAVIRGEHKTFINLAEARFAEYMTAGKAMLAEGKFYQAADSFALARVWMPEYPSGYAAQSLALFGAGEYMSSAYYLSQALTLEPKLAQETVDLSKVVADRDTLDNRLLEIAAWQQRSGSGELAFLMAYIYHQDGRADKAQVFIQTAHTLMPDSAAVDILMRAMGLTPAPAASEPNSIPQPLEGKP